MNEQPRMLEVGEIVELISKIAALRMDEWRPQAQALLAQQLALRDAIRDAFWYGIAGRDFEGLRSMEYMRKTFAPVEDAVVHGTIHEIWKRDPIVSHLQALLAEILEECSYELERHSLTDRVKQAIL